MESVMALWEQTYPMLPKIGQENYERLEDRELPMIWLNIEENDETSRLTMVDVIKSSPISEKFTFLWMDANQFPNRAKLIGGGKVPSICAEDPMTQYMWRYAGEIDKA